MRRARSPIVVGRPAEMGAIGDGLRSAAARHGSCLILLGEAGTGKTRLLREAREQAERRGMAVLAAGPSRIVAPPSYGVLAAALRTWTRAHEIPHDRLAPFAVGLRQVLPEWSAPVDAGLSPDQVRLLSLEGAFRLLVHAAGRAGAALLLDDLQDADPETVEFLHHAAASAPGEAVLIVGAARVPEGRQMGTEAALLRARGLASVFEPNPLSEEEVGQLLEAALQAAPPATLVSDIAAKSDGIPLFVEELLEAQLASGAIRVQHGRVLWDATATDFPKTIIDLVTDKLAQLSSRGRQTIAVGALLGRLDPDLLAATTGLAPPVIAASLRAGVGVGLLEATPTELAFRHAIIRGALLETLLPTERTGLHHRAAEAIARIHRDDPAWLHERAHHLHTAGDDDAAAALLTQSGRWNLDRQAPASAETALRQANALARRAETARRAREALADAVGQLGRWEEALRLDREISAAEGDRIERLLRMAGNAVRAQRLDEADELLRRAGGLGADASAVAALSALAMLYRGRLDEAVQEAELALAAGARPHPRVACQALDVLGRANDALGRRADAEIHFRQWSRAAQAAGLVSEQVQALMELGTVSFLSGGPAAELVQARDLASRHGLFVPLVLADLSLTWWLGRRARPVEACAHGLEAVDLCRRFSLDLLPHALMALGWATDLATCGSGDALVAEALGLAADDIDLQILANWIRGESALRAGMPHEAIPLLHTATKQMHAAPSAVPPPAPFLLPVALLLAQQGDEAAQMTREARSSPALPRQYVNRLWLACDEALLSGSPAEFEMAITPYATSAPFDVAVAKVAAAEILRGTHAISWLRDALTTFTAGGLDTDAARARRLLRALGAPVPRTRRNVATHDHLRAHGVTPREAEVLTLVAQGLTNNQIAERLFLSNRTVQTHISSLITKLQVINRAGLIAVGYRLEHDT